MRYKTGRQSRAEREERHLSSPAENMSAQAMLDSDKLFKPNPYLQAIEARYLANKAAREALP